MPISKPPKFLFFVWALPCRHQESVRKGGCVLFKTIPLGVFRTLCPSYTIRSIPEKETSDSIDPASDFFWFSSCYPGQPECSGTHGDPDVLWRTQVLASGAGLDCPKCSSSIPQNERSSERSGVLICKKWGKQTQQGQQSKNPIYLRKNNNSCAYWENLLKASSCQPFWVYIIIVIKGLCPSPLVESAFTWLKALTLFFFFFLLKISELVWQFLFLVSTIKNVSFLLVAWQHIILLFCFV